MLPSQQPKLEHSSYRQPLHSSNSRSLPQNKFSQLYKSVELMRQFTNQISNATKKLADHNNVVYKYCSKYGNLNFCFQQIVNLLEKRIERMIKNRKIKRNWSHEDIHILVWIVSQYAVLHNLESIKVMSGEDWENISRLIPGTTGESCMFRVLNLRKIKLSEESWTKQQSVLLYDLVESSAEISWKSISQDLFKANQNIDKIYRNPKQCKEHWTCYLNPALRKGPWKIEEDIKLLAYVAKNKGRKKWAEMTKIFQGRTENALKNRFTLILEKVKHQHLGTELNKVEASLQALLRQIQNKELINNNNGNGNDRKQEQEQEQEQEQPIKDVKNEGKQEAPILTNPQLEHSPTTNHRNFIMSGQSMFSIMYSGRSEFFVLFGTNQSTTI